MLHSSDLRPFLKGGSKFWLPPPEEGIWKIKNGGGGSMVQGQVFIKGGRLALFLFNFFKVYHFYIWKLLYPLQNCVMHLKKKIFCHHNYMKKVHSKLSKTEPESIPWIKITYLWRDLKDYKLIFDRKRKLNW